MSARLCLALAAAVVAGCTAIDPSEGKFVTNDRTVTRVSSTHLEHLRQAWTGETATVARRSMAPALDVRWSLDYIASIESSGVKPCTVLELVAVRPLEPKPFNGLNARGERVSFAPKTFHESWAVKACDEWHDWRVFDEASDAGNPLRVLLWTRRMPAVSGV